MRAFLVDQFASEKPFDGTPTVPVIISDYFFAIDSNAVERHGLNGLHADCVGGVCGTTVLV